MDVEIGHCAIQAKTVSENQSFCFEIFMDKYDLRIGTEVYNDSEFVQRKRLYTSALLMYMLHTSYC